MGEVEHFLTLHRLTRASQTLFAAIGDVARRYTLSIPTNRNAILPPLPATTALPCIILLYLYMHLLLFIQSTRIQPDARHRMSTTSTGIAAACGGSI